MNLKQRIESFERDSKVLEKIASSYSEESQQYQALRRATIALWYVVRERYDEFREYVENFDRDLSPAEKQHLREMGIDPNADPGEPT